ncbi:hypothetical protein [Bacteroides xylanisolvens]|uniref:hypothetical protein n=1 Tax=Bacteroides xylanisolvens TaxID=371601 RepID=UPI00147E0824|nr:hypothetical protein [Bacteroides xylanisolvens]MBT9861901.1 hypothetical protein [Bacteroides xylanisolvens]
MDELVQTSTEVSRAMYLTCSSLLHHFIVCSTPSPTQRNPSSHSTDFCPRDESIYPACWAYIFSVVSIYTYYAEYIDPSANLRKLNALKALYLVCSIFLRGMSFSAFSRYFLLSRRLQTTLKRLKPDYNMNIQ